MCCYAQLALIVMEQGPYAILVLWCYFFTFEYEYVFQISVLLINEHIRVNGARPVALNFVIFLMADVSS